MAARGWDRKRRTDRQQPAGEEDRKRRGRTSEVRGKEEKEAEKERGRKGKCMQRRGAERGGVTGTPAAMADSSFCLHLSFPVTVPSSCFSGYKTEGQVTHRHTNTAL